MEYDIDVALQFNIEEKDYSASEVRGWVYDAIKDHTEKVDSKGPCIRVTYKDGYHVDLVVYAVQENIYGEKVFKLAHKSNGWRDANPEKLLKYISATIMDKFKDTEDTLTKTNQFRRIVRYLRRWDDEALPFESDAKPSGLAYILLVNQYLGNKLVNVINNKSDDLSALMQISSSVASIYGRISIQKPTPEYEDMFSKINDQDMKKLIERFKALAAVLQKVKNEPKEKEACNLLKKQFGRDFPIPENKGAEDSLMNQAFVAGGLNFPDKPIMPNKPGYFA
jgi:hypothetical protein